MFIVPFVPITPSEAPVVSTATASSLTSVLSAPVLPQIPRTVRIAIYTESNTTRPSYSSIGLMAYNGLDNLTNVLIGAGYQVTNLTTDDIYDHQLLTSRFDLLIIPDNLPRERIVNQVKEFWLGGGGILSFDSAISYVCYAGILPHESEGSENYGVYWSYGTWATQHDIQVRHPVTKNYQVNQLVNTENMDFGKFDWAALAGTSAAGEVVLLAHMAGVPNAASIVAYDSSVKGGRFVQLPLLGPIPSGMENLVIDACDWLCPRPKARILYDLRHDPYYGVDSWDPPTFDYYSDWRDGLVNRSYTFDKLYPYASGTITGAILAPYDVLIMVWPQINFTAAEVTAITNWVQNGGSLLAMGDNPGVGWTGNINYLLSNMDLSVNLTAGVTSGTYSYMDIHPTTEGCGSIDYSTCARLNYTGSAYPIWGQDAGNTLIAANELGAGRVILTGDCQPWQDGYLPDASNLRYAINMINWLSATDATVLLYVDEPYSPNYYRTPVCQALHELGVSYYLTFNYNYMNLSMHTDPWDLIIVDDPWFIISNLYDEFINYIESGGHFLMSGYTVDNDPTHPLWRQLGFEFAADGPDQADLFIWDSGQDIFNQPILYGAANFTNNLDYGDEGDKLTVFDNATALAGFTSSPAAGNASIVLRNDFRTLYNGYLIDEFTGDTDDSAYPDNLELWVNEIAFMMRPICAITPDVPVNVTEGHILTFHANVTNLGFSAALMGEITANVPVGLGTLMDPATQPFNIPSGGFTIQTWHVNVTGTGNFTLIFSTTYHGLPGTTYSGVPAQADVEALSAPPPPTPIPPLPWWWWIVVVGVVIIIVVVIFVYVFILRPKSVGAK
jgi:hypothetical protein